MNIAAGLAGLKAAADLTKTMRDAAKAGTLKPDEFVGRVGEIYDYIIDSRAALVDAQEELQRLKDQIRELQDKSQLGKDLVFDGYVYWLKDDAYPYCPLCWDRDRKLVRLRNLGTDTYSGVRKTDYHCGIHSQSYLTATNADKHEIPSRY
jgi:hypothetical protein